MKKLMISLGLIALSGVCAGTSVGFTDQPLSRPIIIRNPMINPEVPRPGPYSPRPKPNPKPASLSFSVDAAE